MTQQPRLRATDLLPYAVAALQRRRGRPRFSALFADPTNARVFASFQSRSTGIAQAVLFRLGESRTETVAVYVAGAATFGE